MTSAVKKITLTSELVDNVAIHKLASFDDILVSINATEFWNEYNVDLSHNNACTFRKNDVDVLCINHHIWQSLDSFISYADVVDQEGVVVAVVAEESMIGEARKITRENGVYILPLPSTLQSLEVQIDNLISFKHNSDVMRRMRDEADVTASSIKNILSVSRELNGVRDIPKLLNLILKKTREATHADAGSIYIIDYTNEDTKEGSIIFQISQNESVVQNFTEYKIPINEQSIVGSVVLNEKIINISDLFKSNTDSELNPFGARHDISWEQRIGYRCRSMLSIPIFDISNNVIGVIQLINAKIGTTPLKSPQDFQDRVIPFDEQAIEYAEIIAYQAGIALENAYLTEEKQELFESFVAASVTAIEQRDPTTSGHSNRVSELSVKLAHQVHESNSGVFKDIYFTEDQFKELEYSALLHDFGKFGVREQVLLKSQKLYSWQYEILLSRFELIKASYEIEYLRELNSFYLHPESFPAEFKPEQLKEQRNLRLTELDKTISFIFKCNEPTVLEQKGFDQLQSIANQTYERVDGSEHSFLTNEEVTALSVSRGSLTREEFAEIQSHVVHTYDFLRKIPWGKNLANIPQIALKHHELLDGSGYPTSCLSDQIPIQSRIMAIVDVYDALTSSDRPYKKAVPPERAREILELEVKAGKYDKDLFDLFIQSGCYKIS